MVKAKADVLFIDHGSLVGIAPKTASAREWVEENVHSESWQWLGGFLNVDSRFADSLLFGMEEAGLVVEQS